MHILQKLVLNNSKQDQEKNIESDSEHELLNTSTESLAIYQSLLHIHWEAVCYIELDFHDTILFKATK